jgi:hypothetical protein
MGYDFDDTLTAIAAAQNAAAALGVQLTAYDPTPGAQPVAVAAPAAKALPDDANQRHLEMLSGAMVQLLGREQPAPTITVNLPEQRTENHHHIAAPKVEIRNAITTPEPIVHVEAVMPEYRTDAPSVTVVNQVQPADVIVNNAHPVRAVQTVERDASDEILRTVTTYET